MITETVIGEAPINVCILLNKVIIVRLKVSTIVFCKPPSLTGVLVAIQEGFVGDWSSTAEGVGGISTDRRLANSSFSIHSPCSFAFRRHIGSFYVSKSTRYESQSQRY